MRVWVLFREVDNSVGSENILAGIFSSEAKAEAAKAEEEKRLKAVGYYQPLSIEMWVVDGPIV